MTHVSRRCHAAIAMQFVYIAVINIAGKSMAWRTCRA